MSRIKIKKVTPYLAASIALIASSAVTRPAHAAIISAGAGVLQGTFTGDPNTILPSIFANPGSIQSSPGSGQSGIPGLTGPVQFSQQTLPSNIVGTNQTATATVPITTLTANGTFQGTATSSVSINTKGRITLLSSDNASLPQGGGSTLNTAISDSIFDQIVDVTRKNVKTGSVQERFTFRVNGITSGTGLGAGAAAMGLLVNGQLVALRNSQGSVLIGSGTTTLRSDPVTVALNTPTPVRIGFGTTATIIGGLPGSANADFSHTVDLTGLDFTDPTTGAAISSDQITASSDAGLDLVQAAAAGAAATAVPEPPATLGLLLLGAGVVGSSQLKKRKLASKKA